MPTVLRQLQDIGAAYAYAALSIRARKAQPPPDWATEPAKNTTGAGLRVAYWAAHAAASAKPGGLRDRLLAIASDWAYTVATAASINAASWVPGFLNIAVSAVEITGIDFRSTDPETIRAGYAKGIDEIDRAARAAENIDPTGSAGARVAAQQLSKLRQAAVPSDPRDGLIVLLVGAGLLAAIAAAIALNPGAAIAVGTTAITTSAAAGNALANRGR